MGLACIREGQDCPHTCCELSTVDQSCDLRQMSACDADQKEDGFDAMGLRKMLIRTRYGRNQLTTSTENLKRTLLRLATNQINDSVHSANRFLKALGLEVDHRACAELANEGYILCGCSCDCSRTRATGQLNRISANVSCRPVNENGLASFQLGLIKQPLPSRYGNDGNGGSFNVGLRAWLFRDHR